MQKQIKGPSLKDTSQDSQDNDNGTPQQPDYSPLGLRALDETSEAGRATIVIIKREDKEKPSISFAEEVPSAEEAPKQVLPSLPPSTSPQSPPPESTHLLWKACKVDVKINVYSLAFSILTLPFLVLLMMQLGEGQFSDQFGSSELQLGSSETLSDSDMLVALLGANRTVWALWAIVLRVASAPPSSTSTAERSKLLKRFLPLTTEICITTIVLSFSKVRSNQSHTIATFCSSLYIHVIFDIIMSRSLSHFLDSFFINAILVPAFVTVMVYLLPTLMVWYAFSLERYFNTPGAQFVVISIFYPTLMMTTKAFMLGNIGSSILFNRRSNTNEDFDLTMQNLYNYESTVRAVHGLWLPQVVGIYFSLSYSTYLFMATLGFRVFAQSIGKYVIFRTETNLIKAKCKLDGVFDFDSEKKVTSELNRVRPELSFRREKSRNFEKLPLRASFKVPKTINVGADDFNYDEEAKKLMTLSKYDFGSMGMETRRDNDHNLLGDDKPVSKLSPESNSPKTPRSVPRVELKLHTSRSTNLATENVRLKDTLDFENKVNQDHLSILDATINLRTNKAAHRGHEYDIKHFKTEYEELHRCKQVLKSAKTSKSDGWQAVGRQELGCQTWLKESIDDYSIVKAVGTIESCQPYEVFKFLRDHENSKHPEYMKQTETTLLDEHNSGNRIYRTQYPFVSPFSARDLVFRQRCFRLPDGSFVITLTSTTHPDAEESKSHIRMNLRLGGFLIEPLHYDDVRKVNIYQYNEADPGGSLPRALARIGATKSVKNVAQVKSHFWHLSLWPVVRDRYMREELSCIDLVITEIEDFERSKNNSLLHELSWETNKTIEGIENYYKKDIRNGQAFNPEAGIHTMLTTTVQATSVEVASHLFFKLIDDEDELVRRNNDHTFLWYMYYRSKLVHDRDAVYISTRKQLNDGSFIVCFKSVKDDTVPEHEGAIRTEGHGGYIIKPKSKRSCEVTRFHYFDFKGSLPGNIMRKLLLGGSIKQLSHVKSVFLKKAEGKRIEEIRKARILESSVEWRTSRDEYTEHEKFILRSGKVLFRQIVDEIGSLGDLGWLEINEDSRQNVEMYRKTVTTIKGDGISVSGLASSSGSEAPDIWERRISNGLRQSARVSVRLSARNGKGGNVTPIIDNDSKDSSESYERKPPSDIKRIGSYISRGSSSAKLNSKFVYHGFARTTIECDASLVMAWCCDDHFAKGIRQSYDRPAFYQDLEETNDHNKVDYRQHNLEWPLKARFVVMNHVKEEDENGIFWIVSRSIDYDKDKLPPKSSNALQVEAYSICRITPTSEGLCEFAYWAFSDPKGAIPNWVLKINVPAILSHVTKCKEQLDKNSLAAKRLTFSERMAKMRKRVAIKWNNEALVEKSCNVLGGLVAKYFVDLSYETLFFGFLCFFVQESSSDILTIVMCKKYLGIDMVKNQLQMKNKRGAFFTFLCCLSATVSCTVAFCFVQVFIKPEPLPADYFW